MGGYGAFIFAIAPAVMSAFITAVAIVKARRNKRKEAAALELYDTSPATRLLDAIQQAGRFLAMGTILLVGTVVYRWRRWRHGRQSRDD